jgi:hypothetical protein
MKSCPTCNRTYPDDTLAFCLMDGAVLSAPYDHSSEPRRAPPSPTEVMPRAVVSEDQVIPETIQSVPLSTMQASPPSVPSVNMPDEKESKVSAEDLDRLVKVWDDKAARRSVPRNKVNFVVMRLLAFGLVVLSGFFGLRGLGFFLQENSFRHGWWQLGLAHAVLALILGWGAWRCWRLSTSS